MNGQTLTRHPRQLQEALRLHQAGQPRQARQQYEKLLRREPANIDLLKLQGVACIQLGDFAQAAGFLRRAQALQPEDVEILTQLGCALTQLKQDKEALAILGEAVRLGPDNVDAHFYLGQQLIQSQEFALALAHFAKVIELNPSHPGAWRSGGSAAMALKHYADAMGFFDMALKLQPADVEVLSDRAAAHVYMGNHAQALADYDELVKKAPNFSRAWNNRGICLEELGRVEEAVASYERALALDSSYPEPHSNKAKALMQHARVEEAIVACDRALAVRPDYPEALMNRAMSIMTTGRLLEGLKAFESRWQRPGALRLQGPAQRWNGDADLGGRSLVIFAEQGLGDTLHFCRYALMALDRVGPEGRVILQVQAPVARLMKSLDPRIEVVVAGSHLPAHDFYCPMMSLPLAFGTDIDNIPAPIPYLHADPQDIARWRERLGADPRMKVGLVWSGGFRQDQPELWSVNRRRNIELELLAPLAGTGARFISLQKGADSEAQLHALQARGWDGPAIEDYTAELGDFADTAALVQNLDLVISVDTSTAHLAAALGKPTWILNRLDTCWRWFLEREDSPWYPSVRLFRQKQPGDWTPVVARVREELAQLVAAHPTTAKDAA